MFGLVVRFTLEDGAQTAFDQLADETVAVIWAREPGTLVYAVHTVADKPEQRIFYELYRDRAAFDEHERQEHVRRFLAERERFLDAVDVDFLSLQAGAGILAAAER